MTHETPKESWLEVLTAFLRLGLTSFGGPVAHLGYFREEFVTRRGWLDDRSYGDLVALCQFLPGPDVCGLPLRFGRDLFQDGLPHLLIGLDESHDLGR